MVEKQGEKSAPKAKNRAGRGGGISNLAKHTNENTQKKDAEEAQQVWRERGGLA